MPQNEIIKLVLECLLNSLFSWIIPKIWLSITKVWNWCKDRIFKRKKKLKAN